MALFYVDNIIDIDDGNLTLGNVSLREAIGLANASAGADIIKFSSAITGSTINLNGTELVITDSVTIDGDTNGDDVADITVSGSDLSRVFDITGGTSTLDALVITNGSSSVGGGGMRAASTAAGLTIINSTIRDSVNTGFGGGGIQAESDVTIINSTISGNTTLRAGGGIYVSSTANSISITNSTISGNTAQLSAGGGLRQFNSNSTIDITNSTFVGNFAGQGGGGLQLQGITNITNSTITGNQANYAGGVSVSGTLTFTNSISAGNSLNNPSSGNNDVHIVGGLQPGTGIFNGVNVFSLAGAGDAQDIIESTLTNIFETVALVDLDGIFGQPAFNAGIIADNGGTVETVAIAQGGVAHNAGDDAALSADTQDLDGDANTTEDIPFDARGTGFNRVEGGQSDVGALEFVTVNLPAIANDDVVTTAEDTILAGDLFADNGSGADSDPEADPFSVTEVNGNAGDVGVQVTLVSGALLLVNANGTFTYDPNGTQDSLPDPASGASNLSALDNFSYTITDGDTAAVTVTITGVDSDDILIGSAGAETLNGGIGNDFIEGGAGDDIIDGGVGNDTATYENATAGVTQFLLFTGLDTGGAGTDTLSGIENLTGSEFVDRLAGDGNDNILTGNGGDDILKGKGGNDTFHGGDGNDKMVGGAGDDIMFGGAGADTLIALAGLDTLNGEDGDDFLFGGQDSDVLNGGAGADNIRGNLGVDVLNGGAGSDTLRGGGSNDTLNGGADNDFLFGENHSDMLFGGAGDDSLTGGLGGGAFDGFTDTFVYKDTAGGGGGFDRIKDFENGIDVMDLQSFGFADFAAVQAISSNSGVNMRINFGGGDVLFVEDFQLADFDAGDVII